MKARERLAGLFHWNCRHKKTIWYPGVKEAKGKEDYDPDKVADTYKIEQQQRALERKIREYKRMAATALDPDTVAHAEQNVRIYQAALSKLVADARHDHYPIYRQYNKEQVGFDYGKWDPYGIHGGNDDDFGGGDSGGGYNGGGGGTLPVNGDNLPRKHLTDFAESGIVETADDGEQLGPISPEDAASIKRSEEYGEKHLAGKVSYAGARVPQNVEKVNATLTELTARYHIKRLESIKTKEDIGKSKVAGANGGEIVIKVDYLNDPDAEIPWETRRELMEQEKASLESSRATIQARLDLGGHSPTEAERALGLIRDCKEEIARIDDALQYERDSVAGSSSDRLRTAIIHEFGHVLADQACGQTAGSAYCEHYAETEWIRNMITERYNRAMATGDIHKVSRYAARGDHEFFAECFAAHYTGIALPGYIEEMLGMVLKQWN